MCSFVLNKSYLQNKLKKCFVFLSSHGNNCAGVIAAVANNSFCGVGIAYSASIGGNLNNTDYIFVRFCFPNMKQLEGRNLKSALMKYC